METQNNNLQKFDKIKAEITLFVEPTMKMTITDKESLESVMDAGKQVKSFMKKIEERRKELVKPFNDEVDRINAYAKSILEPLKGSESYLKVQLVNWEKHLEQLRVAELKKAEEERKRKAAEAAAELKAKEEEALAMADFMPEAQAKQAEVITKVEAERTMAEINHEHKKQVKEIASSKVAGTRKVWVHEILDQSQIPFEFFTLDETKIRAAIKAGTREIPGVRIFEDTRIALGGR